MRSLLVANPKGGAGKTTLAVNLSGALASRGERVTLMDLDRQKSALQWLGLRSSDLPVIDGGTDVRRDGGQSDSNRWLVIDSPAGLRGKNLQHAVKLASVVLVPVQPSLFDMSATGAFLEMLIDTVGHKKRAIGIVGMRVDPRTRAASTLEAFLAQFHLPVVAYLRDTQLYANAAFSGRSIFDVSEYLASREIAQWRSMLDWIVSHGQ